MLKIGSILLLVLISVSVNTIMLSIFLFYSQTIVLQKFYLAFIIPIVMHLSDYSTSLCLLISTLHVEENKLDKRKFG